MKLAVRTSALALAIAAGWSLPVQAQSGDAAMIQQELAAMREQMARMAARIDTLEGQLTTANARADAAVTAAGEASTQASAAATLARESKSTTTIKWKGAPELSDGKGWSFKPRGRLQIDAAGINAPDNLSVDSKRLGFSSEFRRAYIGFDGTMPGGFGYRVEANLADSAVDLTDLYLTYSPSKEVVLTLGQQKPFWGMEEMTSDLFTSMMERAAFSQAFGFERRIGASVAWSKGPLLVQAGLFTDDANALGSDSNKSWSADARVVAAPKLAGGILHLGGSFHTRELNGSVNSVQYRARPFAHTTDVRFVDTGKFSATRERAIGAELAYIRGRFHATGELYWMKTARAGAADATFTGGYAELGYFLTDDVTAYKGGAYDRTRPKHALGAGGMGALQVNARYDWLDLNDAGLIGGRQQTAGVSLVWTPVDYVRFTANYGHVRVKDAPVTAAGDGSYSADTLGMRAQFDF